MDICPSPGGIWLDRVELEIIMVIGEEALIDGGVSVDETYSDVHYQEGPNHAKRAYPKRRKRGGMFENLLEIFD